jgi:LysM repeat protein
VQVAAVGAPAGVVKDAAVPIEAKQQAENAQVSAGVETKEVVVPAAGKEVTPEQKSAPAAEADKVAEIKPNAVKDAKQPEPKVVKKNQQIKNSSSKSVSKVSQKQGKTEPPKYHVIAKGDTLMSLSRKYNTDPDKLRKLNWLHDESILKVGSKIKVN